MRLVLRDKPGEMNREESFQYYQSREPEELFDVKPTRIALPERARLFDSYICAGCGERTGANWVRMHNGKPFAPTAIRPMTTSGYEISPDRRDPGRGISNLRRKTMTLETFFHENPRVALAFSGGVDSAYLLYAARACGAQVRAYYVQTAFQPAFEREDALRLVRELGAEMTVLPLDILDREEVCANPPQRCYHCKRAIFSAILQAAAADGFDLVIDGTNASDDAGDRPGMRALRELSVRSPCGSAG